jgi:uncharacterized protein YjbI with pentapeptide repeats
MATQTRRRRVVVENSDATHDPTPSPIELTADCANCFGLCCVAPAFAKSADFAIDKRAGRPCPNLMSNFGCGIHETLRQQGFPGCTTYDCFGAGQHVAQTTFAGRSWREDPESASAMFAVFDVMRQLHELLWHLNEARAIVAAASLRDWIDRAFVETEELTNAHAETLMNLDVDAHRQSLNVLLVQASELARASEPQRRDYRGADLVGADLAHTDLRGASLRGAALVGATLARSDLRLADFTGADLRGCNLSAADLSTAIFLTQAQLDAATGDSETQLPPARRRPTHWPTS